MNNYLKGLVATTLIVVSTNALATTTEEDYDFIQAFETKLADIKSQGHLEYCKFYSEFGELVMSDRLKGESIRDILPKLTLPNYPEIAELALEAYKTPIPEIAQKLSIDIFDETHQTRRLIISEFGNKLFIRCYEQQQ
ncbi:MAG: hypothetical protein QGG88_11650 [Gammaproteobacteria bacterium]|nr:hypothetical protein [Gammaproteobacteria bacterium]